MTRHVVVPCVLLLLLGLGLSAPAAARDNAFDRPVPHPAIPLLDEAGRHVLESGEPYSPRMSCGNGEGGGCHDYARITRAYHFEQGREQTRDGFGASLKLPQLSGPGYFGGYTCMGGNNPGWLARKANAEAATFADYGAPDLVRDCGACHAGGGWGEKDRSGRRYDETPPGDIAPLDGDYHSRTFATPARGAAFLGTGDSTVVPWDWRRSGVREGDCLLCHADLSALREFSTGALLPAGLQPGQALPDSGPQAFESYLALRDEKFTRAGHFRYAASALLAYLNIRPQQAGGMALLTVDKTQGTMPTIPAAAGWSLVLNAQGNPRLTWNRAAFDADGKMQMPMLRFPASENCMICHKTSIDRRGFWGFGPDARYVPGAKGLLARNPKGDVHKGVSWTDDSGAGRVIDNCNACHTRQYYKDAAANVDLDADHNFPKGNGDNDVRNDLDNTPSATPCEHCHDRAKKPAFPSGHANALTAHSELWKASGDMAGYPENALVRITRTHLDVISCQTCHIRDLEGEGGKPIRPRYRYRAGFDGRQKIFPYQPATRYFARDRTSGHVLSAHEREAVLKVEGNYDTAAIVDPATRKTLGRVPWDGAVFGEPQTAADYRALKQALDSLLRQQGLARPDVRFVLVESNEYAISHATRPSVEAVQCAECHARKLSGAFSSLVSVDGLLGRANIREVLRLPERSLVDVGVFELGMPYFRVEASGRVVESAADVLYASRLDPSMSLLKAEGARRVEGEFRAVSRAQGLSELDLDAKAQSDMAGSFPDPEVQVFSSRVGHSSLRGFGLVATRGSRSRVFDGVLRARLETRAANSADRKRIAALRAGTLVTDLFDLALTDGEGAALDELIEDEVWIKLPFRERGRGLGEVTVLVSDDGRAWRALAAENRQLVKGVDLVGRFVLARLRQPVAYLAVAQK